MIRFTKKSVWHHLRKVQINGDVRLNCAAVGCHRCALTTSDEAVSLPVESMDHS